MKFSTNNREEKYKEKRRDIFQNKYFYESIFNSELEIKDKIIKVKKILTNFHYEDEIKIFDNYLKEKEDYLYIKKNDDLIIQESKKIISEIDDILNINNKEILNSKIDFSSKKFDNLIEEIENIHFINEEEKEIKIKEINLKK